MIERTKPSFLWHTVLLFLQEQAFFSYNARKNCFLFFAQQQADCCRLTVMKSNRKTDVITLTKAELRDELSSLLKENLSTFERNIRDSFKDEFNRVNQRLKDLESDNRTDKAYLRAARQMGFGFHQKTPYELQGNAAIEDIKESY